jgi:hypothetical protein
MGDTSWHEARAWFTHRVGIVLDVLKEKGQKFGWDRGQLIDEWVRRREDLTIKALDAPQAE